MYLLRWCSTEGQLGSRAGLGHKLLLTIMLSLISNSKVNKFKLVPKSLDKEFQDLFPTFSDGLVRGEPGGFIMPASFIDGADKIRQIRPRKNDVWIVTFPKSGTTWVTEMLWLLKNGLNYEEAASKYLLYRVIYVE